MGEFSGFMDDTSVKTDKLESEKQLCATTVNSINQDPTWQHPYAEKQHAKKL